MYYLYEKAIIRNSNISIIDIDDNDIYGIAFRIGYSDSYTNIIINNISIEISNVSGDYVDVYSVVC